MPVTKKNTAAKPIPVNNLEIKNFKSIKHIKITTTRVNVFIGRPNSGKSNLLEALTLFNSLQPKSSRQSEATLIRYDTLDNLFYDRNISEDIEVSYSRNIAVLTYYAAINTFIQLVNPLPEFLKRKGNYFKRGLSLNEIKSNGPILPGKTGSEKYSPLFLQLTLDGQGSGLATSGAPAGNPIRKYEFKEGANYSNPFHGYLKSSGDNLFTIVQDNPKIQAWITSFFEDYKLEFLLDFSSKKFEIQKKERGIVYKIPFELTPDTLRRMLFYVAAIYSNRGTTMLFEEPESHSFPPYIKELSELIKADKNNNYFITTHSPYFFNSLVEDSKKINSMSFFYVYYEDYQTKIRKLSQKDLDLLWNSSADVFFNIDSLHA